VQGYLDVFTGFLAARILVMSREDAERNQEEIRVFSLITTSWAVVSSRFALERYGLHPGE
jgi:hypothetical protein